MKKTSFKIGLPITIFKEGKSYVAYSPTLDLSTSASTYEKAQSRFLDVTKLFLEELVEMGTLDTVLMGLGWQKIKTKLKIFKLTSSASNYPLQILNS